MNIFCYKHVSITPFTNLIGSLLSVPFKVGHPVNRDCVILQIFFLHFRHIVIYSALAILPTSRGGYGPPPHAPEMLSASTQRWVGIPSEDSLMEHPRIPRRIFQPSSHRYCNRGISMWGTARKKAIFWTWKLY